MGRNDIQILIPILHHDEEVNRNKAMSKKKTELQNVPSYVPKPHSSAIIWSPPTSFIFSAGFISIFGFFSRQPPEGGSESVGERNRLLAVELSQKLKCNSNVAREAKNQVCSPSARMQFLIWRQL